ncbi:MAG: hypothetical protein R3D78_03065 [Paracoccaceae bacterium]
MRLWGVVLAVAIAGAFLAEAAGIADLNASFYHMIQWDPLASIVGGLCLAMAWRWRAIAALARWCALAAAICARWWWWW